MLDFVFGMSHRFNAVKSTGLKMAPKRCWLVKVLLKKVSACWFSRSWGGLWTRRNRCRTGKDVHCGPVRSDTQVSRGLVLLSSLQIITVYIKICNILKTNTFPPSSGRCLLYAGSVYSPEEQPSTLWASWWPAKHLFKTVRKEQRQEAKRATDWTDKTAPGQRGQGSFCYFCMCCFHLYSIKQAKFMVVIHACG